MNYQNVTIKGFLKGFNLFFLMILLTGSLVAQDKTAAGVYNDALAKLKEKNYEAGLPLMEEALTLAEAEPNEKVIGLAKKNAAVAAYNIGNTKRKAKALEEALAMYNKGIELNPDYVSNYYGKSIVLDDLKRDEDALKILLVAAEMYKKDGKGKRGDKLIKKGQNEVGRAYTGKKYDKAVTMGKIFLESHESAEVNYYISRSFLEKADNEMALTHADAAITGISEKDKQNTKDKYYIAKGLALENLKRNADAVSAFKMVAGKKYKKQADFRIQKLGS